MTASAAASEAGPGILGFLVVAGMGVALYFLLRSMNKQLRKVITGPRWRKQAGRRERPQGGGTGPDGPAGQA
jgi:hypothetical protein